MAKQKSSNKFTKKSSRNKKRSTFLKNRRALALAFALLFGAAGVITLLLTRAATPQPVAPISAMALNYGQQNALGDTSRYKYVILQDYMYDKIPSIKAANPNTKVFAYKNVATVNTDCTTDAHSSTGVSYCDTKTNHPDWFLTENGQPFSYCDFNWLYWADIGNTSYQQKWIDNVKSQIKADGFDGVFMDDANTHPGHCMDGQLDKYSDSQYGQAMTNFIIRVANDYRANGLLTMANVGQEPWESTQNTYAMQMAQYLDIFFREHFAHWNTTSNMRITGSSWLSIINQMEAIEKVTNYMGNSYPSGSTDIQTMRYARASFLLAWSGRAGSASQSRPNGNVDPYSPEATSDIGMPVAPRYQVSGGAWRRDFTGGTVIVNPNDSTSVTIALNKPYKTLSDQSVTSISLGPGDAGILKLPDTVPAPAPTDTTAPSVTITTPVNGAKVSGLIAPQVNASDAIGVTKVDFYLDGALKSTSRTKPYCLAGSLDAYSCKDWDTKTVANGLHTLVAKAYDSAGNVGTSASLSFTVSNTTADTTLPSVRFINPGNGTTVRGTVSITGSASDNSGSVSSMKLYIDGQLYTSSSSGSLSTSWNVKSKRIKRGAHTLMLRAKDPSGNTAQTSIKVYK